MNDNDKINNLDQTRRLKPLTPMKSSKPLKPVDNIGDPFKRKDVRNEELPIQNPSSNLRSTTRHELPYISAVEKQKESTNKGPLAKSSEWDDTLRGVLAREMVKHRVSSPSSSNAQMKNQSIERDSVKVSSAYDPVERKRSSSSGKSVRVRDQNVKRSQQVIRNEARMTEVSKKKFYLPLLRRLQRKTPSKRYRLKGFANEEYANQVRAKEKRTKTFVNISFWIVLIVIFLILFYWINPIDRIQRLMELFGI